MAVILRGLWDCFKLEQRLLGHEMEDPDARQDTRRHRTESSLASVEHRDTGYTRKRIVVVSPAFLDWTWYSFSVTTDSWFWGISTNFGIALWQSDMYVFLVGYVLLRHRVASTASTGWSQRCYPNRIAAAEGGIADALRELESERLMTGDVRTGNAHRPSRCPGSRCWRFIDGYTEIAAIEPSHT